MIKINLLGVRMNSLRGGEGGRDNWHAKTVPSMGISCFDIKV